jgi:multidrug efflux system membrane fusion protein
MVDQPANLHTFPSRPDDDIGVRAAADARPGIMPRPHRLGRWLLYLLLLAALGVVVWVVARPTDQGARRITSTGPIPVAVAPVQKGDLPVQLNELGTVTPIATVTVRTQLNGQLVAVAFQEGQLVNKGDFLAQIDPRPYQVALEQAEGQLGKDQALLNNAQVDLKRYDTLVAQNSIATQTRDTQVALVAQDQATVKADQAQIDAQKLNLTYAHIISPVTGRVGLRQVDAGNYVQTSDPNGIVVVTQLQPISVIFTLPEDNLPTLMKRLHAGASMPVIAFDRTGTTQIATGKLATVDNQIDPTTGTVKLRAVFDNPEDALFPNQFVNVRLLVDTMHGAEIVPVAAIQRGAPGTFVYVVGADQKVTMQKVKLGPSDGQNVAVREGLQEGQKVVVDGADRLKVGAEVTVAAPAQPAAEPASAPAAPQPGQARGETGRRNGS